MMIVFHIDDDDFDRAAMARAFRAATQEIELFQFATMAKAIKVMQIYKPQMVLVDLHLPDCDDPVKAVEAAMPAGCSIIVLSGAPLEEIRSRAYGYPVQSKSPDASPLLRSGNLLPLAVSISDNQISVSSHTG